MKLKLGWLTTVKSLKWKLGDYCVTHAIVGESWETNTMCVKAEGLRWSSPLFPSLNLLQQVKWKDYKVKQQESTTF